VVEDHFYAAAGWVLRRVGWRPRLETYSGYGTPDKVRVLARVLLSRPRPPAPDLEALRAGRRGFRHFLTVPVPHRRVLLDVGGHTAVVTSDRAGYVDVEIPTASTLPAGWQSAVLTVLDEPDPWEAEAAIRVLDEHTRFGVISDMDDTTMVTAVPRPLLAAWNTFVRHSSGRRAVPGMPELYRTLQEVLPVDRRLEHGEHPACLPRAARLPAGAAAPHRLGPHPHRVVPQRTGAQGGEPGAPDVLVPPRGLAAHR
jgi:phosphatidate phosphatase APP1